MIWPQLQSRSAWRDLALGLLPDRASPDPPSRPKRLLILQPDHLGDVLFTTPALRLLRRALPSARIEIVVGPWSRRVLFGNPNLDQIHSFQYPWFDRQRSSPLQRLIRLGRLAWLIRRRRPDVVLIMRPDFWWGALAAWLAGAPAIVGHRNFQTRGLLTQAPTGQPTATHIADLDMSLAAFVARADPVERRRLDFHITDEDRIQAKHLLDDSDLTEGRLVVVHVGAGAKVKRWPADYFARVSDKLAANHQAQIVLTAGPDETKIAGEVAASMNRPATNLAGKTSLGSLAAILELASLAIGADSGPLNLAVALGTPSLHLFGPASAARYGPYGEPGRHIVIKSPVACSPCGRLDIPESVLVIHDCVRAISPEQVLAAADELIAKYGLSAIERLTERP